MRNNIVSLGADELKYEIREIVSVAKEFEQLGVDITWENIGDPVQKGEKLPGWIKDLIISAMKEDLTYGYSPTKGLDTTREFLAQKANKNGGVKITKEDIIFFNGLGDAISKIYGQLRKEYRVIGPSPAYSTHSSAEASHAGSEYIAYNLDPANLWYPDINDIRMKVKYNPSISGILLINPDAQILPLRVLDADGNGNSFDVADAIYYAADRRSFFEHAASYTTSKVVFDLNPRQYALDEVVGDLRAAGFERVETRPFFVPQTRALPTLVAAGLRAAETVGPLARLALRFRFTLMVAAFR